MRYKYFDEKREPLRKEDGETSRVVVGETSTGGESRSPFHIKPSVKPDEVMDAATKLYEETYNSFYLFVEKIFSVAIAEKYGKYIGGEYVKKCCDFLQSNKRTMYCGPRQHYKSLRFYCFVAWLIWKNKKDKKNLDIAYISYNQDLSGAHVAKIKELIEKSFFAQEGLYDEYSTATSKAEYIWMDEGNKDRTKNARISINSYSILGALRGLHPTHILTDDFYVDEDRQNVVSIEPEIIKKINKLFRKIVLPMPMPGGQLHVIGTPQSYADIWYQKEFYKNEEDENNEDSLKFNVKLEPAITSWDWERRMYRPNEEKKALWPEMFSLKYLEEQETLLGHQEFCQEYLVQPRSVADSFFEEDRIDESIRLGHEAGLFNYADPSSRIIGFKEFNKDEWIGSTIFGAYDPAKSKDPAHFVVFAYRDGILIQLLSKWMDGWDYSFTYPGRPSQFQYIKRAVEHFGIQRVFGDNTNSVLTTAEERGDIPGLACIRISHSYKSKLAISLQKHLGKSELLLLDDERQKRAFLAIRNEGLKALHSKDNHGESLTTIGLITVNSVDIGLKNRAKRIKIQTKRENIPKFYRGYFLNTGRSPRKDLPFNIPTRRNLMGRLV